MIVPQVRAGETTGRLYFGTGPSPEAVANGQAVDHST
jgi:hypothetical protein